MYTFNRHLDNVYKTAKKDLERYEKKKDTPVQIVDKVWIPPVRTGSGCRFGYWRKVENEGEK